MKDLVGTMSKVSKWFYKSKEDVKITSDIWNRDAAYARDYPQFLPHVGYDYRADVGTELVAGFDGEIIKVVNWLGGSYGRQVHLYNGEYTLHYAHLSRVDVKVGDKVKQGDTIGLSGRSGATDTTYAPHLHLGLAKGKMVNAGTKGGYLGDIWQDVEEFDFKPKPVTPPKPKEEIDRWRKEGGKFTLDYNVNERVEPNTTARIVKTHQKGAVLDYIEWGNTPKHTWFKLGNGNYVAYGERGVEVYGKDTPTPKTNVGKTVLLTGTTYLYNDDAVRFPVPLKNTLRLKILAESKNYYQVSHNTFQPNKVWVRKIDVKVI